jgi:hypothetical protein
LIVGGRPSSDPIRVGTLSDFTKESVAISPPLGFISARNTELARIEFGRNRRVSNVDRQVQLIGKGFDECFVLIALFASKLVIEVCDSEPGICSDGPFFSELAKCAKHCNAVSAAAYGQYTGGSAPALRWP